MIQRIHCEKCGTKHFVFMDADDALDGWQVMTMWLSAKKPAEHFAQITVLQKGLTPDPTHPVQRTDLPTMVCDGCNAIIKDGDRCVAITLFRDAYVSWERNYGTPLNDYPNPDEVKQDEADAKDHE